MKRFLSFLMMAFVAVMAFAESRSVDEAQNAAMSFLQTGTTTIKRAPAQVDLQLSYTLTKPNSTEAAAYLFQIGENGGYVLVSADDNAMTILGYSTEGKFDATNIPENMQVWLQHYAEEIAWAAENGVAMAQPRKASGEAISPLLGEIVWNQGSPFWNKCPMDSDNSRSYTGCVATAAAQIMRFWKHPAQGTGSHSYTWEKSDKSTKDLSANFGNTTYDWDNMIENYNYGYNNTQANAVATLMYHLGVATEMQYSSNGSGTQTEKAAQAMYTYFGYDKSMEAVRPDYTGFEYFNERMLAELQAGRPVLMSGYTENYEGHSFVCDGFDGEYYHINWGWGGYQNDYFALSALDPAAQGMGGAASGEGFHVGILGVMGIQPDQGGDDVASKLGTTGITLGTEEESVKASDTFVIKMNQIRSTGVADFAGGGVGFGVFNEEGEIVAFHSLYALDELPVGYYYPGEYDFEGDLSDVSEDGKYTIAPVFTDEEVTWVEKMDVDQSSILEIPFTKKDDTIYFVEQVDEDPEPEPAYTVSDLWATVNENIILFGYEGDAPYYHVKVYNEQKTIVDTYVDYKSARLSDTDPGTWTIWVCAADADKNDVGNPISTEVTVEEVDYDIHNLQTTVTGSTVNLTFEGNAPYFHVKVYNDEKTHVSGIVDYKNVNVSNVPDGEWTVFVRPVDSNKKYYLGDAVTTTVTVDTRDYITVALDVNDETMGTVTGGGQYRSGDEVSIKATANEGYEFVSWSDEDTNAERVLTLEKTGESPRTISLTATFKKTLTYDVENFEAWVDGNDIKMKFDSDAPWCRVNVQKTGESYTMCSLTKEHEYTEEGLGDGEYSVWVESVDEAMNTQKSSAVVTLTIDTREYITLVLEVNDEAMGTVTGAGDYRSGDTAEIKATPNEGYIFVGWSDGNTDAAREITFEKTGQKERTETLTATFDVDPAAGINGIYNKNMRKGKYLKNGKVYINTENRQYNAEGKVLK